MIKEKEFLDMLYDLKGTQNKLYFLVNGKGVEIDYHENQFYVNDFKGEKDTCVRYDNEKDLYVALTEDTNDLMKCVMYVDAENKKYRLVPTIPYEKWGCIDYQGQSLKEFLINNSPGLPTDMNSAGRLDFVRENKDRKIDKIQIEQARYDEWYKGDKLLNLYVTFQDDPNHLHKIEMIQKPEFKRDYYEKLFQELFDNERSGQDFYIKEHNKIFWNDFSLKEVILNATEGIPKTLPKEKLNQVVKNFSIVKDQVDKENLVYQLEGDEVKSLIPFEPLMKMTKEERNYYVKEIDAGNERAIKELKIEVTQIMEQTIQFER